MFTSNCHSRMKKRSPKFLWDWKMSLVEGETSKWKIRKTWWCWCSKSANLKEIWVKQQLGSLISVCYHHTCDTPMHWQYNSQTRSLRSITGTGNNHAYIWCHMISMVLRSWEKSTVVEGETSKRRRCDNSCSNLNCMSFGTTETTLPVTGGRKTNLRKERLFITTAEKVKPGSLGWFWG